MNVCTPTVKEAKKKSNDTCFTSAAVWIALSGVGQLIADWLLSVQSFLLEMLNL